MVKESQAPGTVSGFIPTITDTETLAGLYVFQVYWPWYPFLRLNVTANTGVTINGLWLLESDIALPVMFAQDIGQSQI